MMDSDLDIARKATTRPVEEVAERLGLGRSDLILQGSSTVSYTHLTLPTIYSV